MQVLRPDSQPRRSLGKKYTLMNMNKFDLKALSIAREHNPESPHELLTAIDNRGLRKLVSNLLG